VASCTGTPIREYQFTGFTQRVRPWGQGGWWPMRH
jgi:hypothetical protein